MARHLPNPSRSHSTTRREFLRLAGGGIILASGGLWAPGCGRLLERSGAAGDGRPLTTGPGSGGPVTTGGTTTTRGTEPTTGGTDRPLVDPPDLVAFHGPDPARNLASGLAALGGMTRFVARGDRVVLKPNVLTGRPPEYAVTTNPGLLGAIAVECWEAGAADVIVLDRPTGAARSAFEASGIARAVADADATLKYLSDRNYENTPIPEGRLLTSWPLVTDVLEADVFINVPIAKTHDLAGLTMAMKNLMGIMGGNRGLIHIDFTQKIVDLNTLIRPHLVVLDATRILLRNGPTGGSLDDVLQLDTVVVGTDQVAVDAYGAGLFEVKPRDLAYLAEAEDRGLGTTDLASLHVLAGEAA